MHALNWEALHLARSVQRLNAQKALRILCGVIGWQPLVEFFFGIRNVSETGYDDYENRKFIIRIVLWEGTLTEQTIVFGTDDAGGVFYVFCLLECNRTMNDESRHYLHGSGTVRQDNGDTS